MKLDDKRKLTSRLNALKSTGPKTPQGKQASSLNASTHGAYARSIVLPGESVDDYEAMVEAHFHQYSPDNLAPQPHRPCRILHAPHPARPHGTRHPHRI